MLVLSRKVGESILIGDNIEVSISRIQGNQVRISIEAPREVSIRRSELPPQTDVPASLHYAARSPLTVNGRQERG